MFYLYDFVIFVPMKLTVTQFIVSIYIVYVIDIVKTWVLAKLPLGSRCKIHE